MVKTMVFAVVIYRSESWTIKKAQHQIIHAFKPCCWRRLLRILWIARRSNQSILKEIHWKDLCWSSNTLAPWCKEPIHWKRPWSWERWKAEGGDRGWDGWMISLTQWTWWLDDITDSMDMSLSKLWEIVKDGEAWHAEVYGVAKSWTEQQLNRRAFRVEVVFQILPDFQWYTLITHFAAIRYQTHRWGVKVKECIVSSLF